MTSPVDSPFDGEMDITVGKSLGHVMSRAIKLSNRLVISRMLIAVEGDERRAIERALQMCKDKLLRGLFDTPSFWEEHVIRTPDGGVEVIVNLYVNEPDKGSTVGDLERI